MTFAICRPSPVTFQRPVRSPRSPNKTPLPLPPPATPQEEEEEEEGGKRRIVGTSCRLISLTLTDPAHHQYLHHPHCTHHYCTAGSVIIASIIISLTLTDPAHHQYLHPRYMHHYCTAGSVVIASNITLKLIILKMKAV
ncbi:hypothetical protein E2C01_095801 [Portunus trituberculatus]|uniref:Uncharacterized protein n=1 Tax=Portunus trituberculatus TaxID=210409 RepID=A0A5B7K6M9_PORTR|nr:hypothetical protein [Portunus trituberculatus]